MGALDAVAAWPVGTATAGVVAGGSSDRQRVGPVTRTLPWASVTKLCTSLAVLVAVEEGTLSLDDPAGPPGATVAHLLSHASGLAPSERRVLSAPGRRRIYSSAGFEVLGEELEARSSLPFERYLREAVLGPLGMDGARLGPGGAAAGLLGTLDDLLALGAELLRPSIVAPSTMARARSVAFPGLDGVLPGFGLQTPCDWGLGFELRDAKSPHWTGGANSAETFGHFGQSGSFLWVDPVADVACAGLSDTAFGPWATVAWPRLADGVLSERRGA
jgi:CubicO group peptidase (beta-lactamase class C family)